MGHPDDDDRRDDDRRGEDGPPRPAIYGRRRADVEAAPVTYRNLIIIVGSALTLGTTLCGILAYVFTLSGRVDMASQKQSSYQENADTQRTMLIADRDSWRASYGARLSDVERRQNQDEAAQASDRTELKTALATLTQKVESLYQLTARQANATTGPPYDH